MDDIIIRRHRHRISSSLYERLAAAMSGAIVCCTGKVGRLVNAVVRNRVYTREELLAYYSSREKAQSEWDNAAPPGLGPRNALTHSEAILKDMRRWYEERPDGEDVSVASDVVDSQLRNTLGP